MNRIEKFIRKIYSLDTTDLITHYTAYNYKEFLVNNFLEHLSTELTTLYISCSNVRPENKYYLKLNTKDRD